MVDLGFTHDFLGVIIHKFQELAGDCLFIVLDSLFCEEGFCVGYVVGFGGWEVGFATKSLSSVGEITRPGAFAGVMGVLLFHFYYRFNY